MTATEPLGRHARPFDVGAPQGSGVSMTDPLAFDGAMVAGTLVLNEGL